VHTIRRSPYGTPPSSTGGVVRLGPGDSGKTITMRVGNQLQITQTANRLLGRWILADYRRVLSPDLRRSTFGQFVLIAIAPGGGAVTLIQSSCGTDGRPCLDRPAPIEPTPTSRPDLPGRIFTVTIRVSD
jgi:hypothetical protein